MRTVSLDLDKTVSVEEAISFRTPMLVTEVMIFNSHSEEYGYYVCPRCKITLEFEYASYCDRCGQCLDWQDCENAAIVYPGGVRSG